MVKSVAKVWGKGYDLLHRICVCRRFSEYPSRWRASICRSILALCSVSRRETFDGTFNDAVLAMCAGALRHYMQRHAELPQDSLKSMVPLSIRAKGDADAGNAAVAITVDLATNLADPAELSGDQNWYLLAGHFTTVCRHQKYCILVKRPWSVYGTTRLTKMPPQQYLVPMCRVYKNSYIGMAQGLTDLIQCPSSSMVLPEYHADH